MGYVFVRQSKERSTIQVLICYPDKDWANRERRRSLCENSDPHVIQDVPDQFSVLLSTYNPERIEHLTLLLRHLLQSPKVHHIYITWHNPALPVPASLSLDNRVTVLEQAFDSLNNRFNPVPGIRTEAVYILDDDIFVDLKDLEFAFEVNHLSVAHTLGFSFPEF